MTMERLEADFAAFFDAGPARHKSCFCKGPARGETECPCALAQKAVESGTHIRAAVGRPALINASSATRDTETSEGEDHV